jgi:indole-3-glycerol phosphate synthase
LRKDFIIDAYQITESRAIGADCVLLIMAALSDTQAVELEAAAHEHGMDVLVEVHDAHELERALQNLRTPLIGINNRNLKTMKIDLQTSINLRESIPSDRIIVCESGIKTNHDIQMMQNAGINCFLVGESLMLQSNVEAATRTLLGIIN